MSCIGCTQAALASESALQTTIKEALKYVEQTKKAVKVFREYQTWVFRDCDAPETISIPGRAVVWYDERITAGVVRENPGVWQPAALGDQWGA